MAVSVPITFNGTLSFPIDTGQSNSSIIVALTSTFQHSAEFKYEFTGAGTQSVDFSTIAATGAKVIVIEVDADSSPAAQPVNITINAGTDQIQISPGGFLVYANPSPAAGGILSMDVAYTAAATVRVHVFG